MSEHKKYTSIKLNARVYNTYKTRPNTIPHALGEFIDNAIGSYQQNKERLIENEPNYKLHIYINIEWVDKKTTKIIIRDNAAGISEHAYQTAFEPAHKPEDDKGLNEFGMGMKDAALWLGDTWRVVSSALGEPIKRDLTFDLKKVADQNLTSLPYDETEEETWKHGTMIEITNPTHNAPVQTKLQKIQEDISGINDCQLHFVNSKKDGEKEIDWSLGSMHILFGAQLLNRGFTINNLSTTYMPRHTVGVATADTIEQRCRFFGYKMKYIKSCRVYLPEQSITNYVDYVDNEEELRTILKNSDTLKEAGHALMSSPNLQQCRKNVLPSDLVKTTMDGNCKMEAFDNPDVIQHNNSVAAAFVKKLEKEKNISHTLYKSTTKQREHRVWNLTIDEAVDFLLDFQFASVAEAVRRDNTVRYIKYLAAWPGCKIDHVEFMQMAYDGKPMRRSFNPDKAKIKSTFYTGADKDSSIYPGDQNVHMSEDTITIQLYNFELTPCFPNRPTAHTLSINYPKKLSTAYCTNNQEIEDIDTLFKEIEEEYESNA